MLAAASCASLAILLLLRARAIYTSTCRRGFWGPRKGRDATLEYNPREGVPAVVDKHLSLPAVSATYSTPHSSLPEPHTRERGAPRGQGASVPNCTPSTVRPISGTCGAAVAPRWRWNLAHRFRLFWCLCMPAWVSISTAACNHCSAVAPLVRSIRMFGYSPARHMHSPQVRRSESIIHLSSSPPRLRPQAGLARPQTSTLHLNLPPPSCIFVCLPALPHVLLRIVLPLLWTLQLPTLRSWDLAGQIPDSTQHAV